MSDPATDMYYVCDNGAIYLGVRSDRRDVQGKRLPLRNVQRVLACYTGRCKVVVSSARLSMKYTTNLY